MNPNEQDPKTITALRFQPNITPDMIERLRQDIADRAAVEVCSQQIQSALYGKSESESRSMAWKMKVWRAIAILSTTALAVAGILWGVA